jgi:hypothetical protein
MNQVATAELKNWFCIQAFRRGRAMFDPLYNQVIVWVGIALLLLLCLPFAAVQRLVLEVSAWALRLVLLGVVGAAAFLWFRPADLPAEVTATLEDWPRLQSMLPEPGTQHFGVCAAALLVFLFLPLLAILDVSRKLAGWRLRRLRALAAEPKVVQPLSEPPAPATTLRRVDRRAAANTLAEAGSPRQAHTGR